MYLWASSYEYQRIVWSTPPPRTPKYYKLLSWELLGGRWWWVRKVSSQSRVPRSVPWFRSKAKHHSSQDLWTNLDFSFLVRADRFYSYSGTRVLHRQNQACKRTIILVPNSPFQRRRSEEKTDRVICCCKQSPRWNQIPCPVQRLPFPACDVEETAITRHLQNPSTWFCLEWQSPEDNVHVPHQSVGNAMQLMQFPAPAHLRGLIDLLLSALKTQKSIISVSMCLLIRLPASAPCVYLIVPVYTHTDAPVNMHTCMHIYRHAHMAY